MGLDRFDAPARLAELLTSWDRTDRDARRSEAGRLLIAEVRGIGEAAAYLGGWDAMQQLSRAVSEAGRPYHHLNELWDCIGAWVA